MAKTITNSDLDKKLAVLEEKVDSGHKALRQQLGAGYELILEKLKPLDDLKKEFATMQATVASQGTTISWIRGIGTGVSVLLGTGAAYLGLVRHK